MAEVNDIVIPLGESNRELVEYSEKKLKKKYSKDGYISVENLFSMISDMQDMLEEAKDELDDLRDDFDDYKDYVNDNYKRIDPEDQYEPFEDDIDKY